MNLHLYAVLNKVINNTREAIPYIIASVSFELETVHLQLELIVQEIQYATYDYLVNIPSPNKNILDTADETISYIA